MIIAGKSRLNYYEMLGVEPTAADDVIAKAFSDATNVLRPHVFGAITELCVAYKTLRDPARRRAYDASLGLTPKPKLPPSPRPASAHFMARPALASAAPPRPPLQTQEPPPPSRIEPRPVKLEPPAPFPLAIDDPNMGISPVEWKRMGAVAGGLAAAAILVGAVGGWWSVSEAANPGQPASAEGAEEEPEKPSTSYSEPRPEPMVYQSTKAPEQRRPAIAVPPQDKPINRRRQLAESQAADQLIQPPPDLAGEPAGDPLAPEAHPVSEGAATMPLPNKTVARTIDRIGYSCGNVASASPVEGAAGVFTVTCTSGQSFQARPVNGRYRFKRLRD